MSDENKKVGRITHYFAKIGVGIIELSDSLKVGDKIKIKGHTTDIEQTVDSIQIDHNDIQEAKAGDVIGIKVAAHVREDDEVLKV